MKRKIALITGITGQDGSLLTRFLLNDESRFSIIPNSWKKQKVEYVESKGDLNGANIDEAIKILEKVKNAK